MFNLNLESGLVEVKLNDNEVIRFNPTAIGFVEDYFQLVNYANAQVIKYADIEKKAKENNEDLDKLELSINEYRELYTSLVERIDKLFGKDTVAAAKRSVNDESDDMGLLIQLIDGMGKFVLKASNEKIEKYTKQYMNRAERRAAERKKK